MSSSVGETTTDDLSGGELAHRGVLFVATGARYLACARNAAASVRENTPELPIALFTDADTKLTDPHAGSEQLFDFVFELEASHHRSKIDCMARSPFRQTLFLDADVRVKTDIADIFSLLERFDIAMSHAHARNRPATRAVWKTELSDAFPQFNTGVVVFRRNAATQALLDAWCNSYRKAGFRKDQVTLRELLWKSNLRIATLPPEYNIRYPKYLWIWAKREARPRICHFPAYGYETWASYWRMRIATLAARPLISGARMVRSLRAR